MAESEAQKTIASTVSPKTRSRTGLPAKVCLLAFGTLLALAMMEGFCRYFITVTDVAFQFWDPVVGLRRKPNQKGNNIVGSNIRGTYNCNAQGWNYPRDFEAARRPGVMRICLLGDSYVEAMQVPCEKQMAVVAEDSLTRNGVKTECYPFGCSGFGTAHEYQLIRHYVVDYKPDLVLIFFTQNDIHDCSPYLSGIEPYTYCFSLDDAGELLAMPPTCGWERGGLRRAIAGLALTRYVVLQKRLLESAAQRGPERITRREVEAGRNDSRFLGANMTNEEQAKKSWLLFEKLLLASQAECARIGAGFGVVFRGGTKRINAAQEGKSYSPPGREVDPYCLFDFERELEMGPEFVGPICAKHGIPYLDMGPILIEKVKATRRPHNFPDDDHYNTDGHQWAGEAIAQWVQELIRTGKLKPKSGGISGAAAKQGGRQ